MELSPVAQRVLGSLVEKAMATPQAYPLSLNALTAAANQTTNREPVTSYAEDEVAAGVRELMGLDLAGAAYARRSSTPKYEHRLDRHLELGAAEVAVLGVLLLRGPQTVGELRLRTERLHPLPDLGAAHDVLERLAGHHFGALAEELPRQPGQKETRWRHLLGTPADATTPTGPQPGVHDVPPPGEAGAPPSTTAPAGLAERVAELEARVAALEARLP